MTVNITQLMKNKKCNNSM